MYVEIELVCRTVERFGGMQAVMYFQRALKQDRRFLNAWTLMGHEYVEMKNPPAAIGELLV